MENNPLRRWGWTRGVVEGVGVDMVRVRDASGDCVVVLGSVGFVDDLDLPPLLDREPTTISSISTQTNLIVRWVQCRYP